MRWALLALVLLCCGCPVLEYPPGEARAPLARDLEGLEHLLLFARVRRGGEDSGTALLFITAGGNRVDDAKASALAGEPLGKADAALIRAQTGYAIGGVAPLGHLTQPRAWFDPRLLEFDLIWAAAAHRIMCSGSLRQRFGTWPGRPQTISPRRRVRIHCAPSRSNCPLV